MMLLVAFALLSASALAMPKGDMANLLGGTMDMNSTAPTKPCCMPKKWQAALMDLKSDNALTYVTLFARDEENQIEGSLTMPLDGGAPVYQEFTDYKKQAKYVVSMGADAKMTCAATKPDHAWYGSCFEGNANAHTQLNNLRYIGDAMMGGPNGIKYNAWSFNLDGMDITISLTENGCIPLLEGINRGGDQPVDSLMLFNDVSTTITDQSILTVPAACASAVVG